MQDVSPCQDWHLKDVRTQNSPVKWYPRAVICEEQNNPNRAANRQSRLACCDGFNVYMKSAVSMYYVSLISSA